MRAKRLVRDGVGWLHVFLAIAIRPRLWWIALRQSIRVARERWWRRAPFLPLPDRNYLRFRLETAYGEVTAPRPADLIGYLEWCATSTNSSSGRRR
jgi:hypothetical protein